jgi:hypothetical protein
MKCNVGKTEKTIRIAIGVIIILLGLYFKSWSGIIGIAPIVTGIMRYCPLNEVIGVSSCKADKKN